MNKSILFVDDDPRIRELLRATLEPHFSLLEAEGGQKALHILERSSPDLIILDIAMPQMDGFEVCQRIKSNSSTQHIPVIILTGTALSQRDKNRGKQVGADTYFTKPFSPRQLLDKVNEFLR